MIFKEGQYERLRKILQEFKKEEIGYEETILLFIGEIDNKRIKKLVRINDF